MGSIACPQALSDCSHLDRSPTRTASHNKIPNSPSHSPFPDYLTLRSKFLITNISCNIDYKYLITPTKKPTTEVYVLLHFIMRTRSSGPAKDPVTGEVFPDSPQSTIPAFIHEPIPFNPFPEAAFPTLEFPLPQPAARHRRARRIGRCSRGDRMTPSRRGSPGPVASSQLEAQKDIRPAQEVAHDVRPQLEENMSTPSEIPTGRNQHELSRWVSILKPGEFKNDPYWTDINEMHSEQPPMEKVR